MDALTSVSDATVVPNFVGHQQTNATRSTRLVPMVERKLCFQLHKVEHVKERTLARETSLPFARVSDLKYSINSTESAFNLG